MQQQQKEPVAWDKVESLAGGGGVPTEVQDTLSRRRELPTHIADLYWHILRHFKDGVELLWMMNSSRCVNIYMQVSPFSGFSNLG
jgi:hypothetical protein